MSWYKEFGYKESPFLVNPLKNNFELFGIEESLEDILYLANSGSLIFLEGDTGVGKTSVLAKIISEFKGKGRVVRVDCEHLENNLNITNLIWKRPKKMIVLLDNVENLSRVNCDRIRYYFDENIIQSVVFTSKSIKKVKFSEALLDRLGGNIFSLKMPLANKAIKIVRDRLNDKDLDEFLTTQVILKAYELSENFVDFFELLDYVCDYAVDEGLEKISVKEAVTAWRELE